MGSWPGHCSRPMIIIKASLPGRNHARAGGPEEYGQSAQNRLPDEGQSPAGGASNSGALGGRKPIRPPARSPQRRSRLYVARRSPVRQRKHPPRHGAQQDSQGFYRQVPEHGRVQRALRSRLGLPRAADRDQGGSGIGGQKSPDASGGNPPGVPQLRREIRRTATP